jgi:hypothetical protein
VVRKKGAGSRWDPHFKLHNFKNENVFDKILYDLLPLLPLLPDEYTRIYIPYIINKSISIILNMGKKSGSRWGSRWSRSILLRGLFVFPVPTAHMLCP